MQAVAHALRVFADVIFSFRATCQASLNTKRTTWEGVSYTLLSSIPIYPQQHFITMSATT